MVALAYSLQVSQSDANLWERRILLRSKLLVTLFPKVTESADLTFRYDMDFSGHFYSSATFINGIGSAAIESFDVQRPSTR